MLDGLLDRSLEHEGKDEKDVAADTRNSVQEIKKFAGIARTRNPTAAKVGGSLLLLVPIALCCSIVIMEFALRE